MEKARVLKKHIFTIIIITLLTLLTGMIQSAKGQNRKLTAISFTEVTITDEFWAPRIETNRKVTIPYAFKQCEETGRIDNFAIASGLMEGEQHGGYPFDDTDPYKILEGASYSLSVHPDPELDKYLDELIVKIAAAQEDDGYLYTSRTNKSKRLESWYGPERWSNLGMSHELYNCGHLYEAAVAHYRATGKRTLLNVAIKSADLINKVFGPGKNLSPPGHQIIEMGLVRLYRATGDEKYLALAKFLLDQRGNAKGHRLYDTYSQDHKPVVEQDEAVGHAVRATYMYCGMADVAALTGDVSYVKAIDRIWENVVSKKLYLTGGIGAAGGHEGFAGNYELPNMSAYCETCAAIGNVMWNHRMFLAHGDAKYIDMLERVLYNGALSGISMDGDRFFYPNPLESVGQHSRSPWFGCACCPSNVARFIPSVPGYTYAYEGNDVYLNLFIGGDVTIKTKTNTVRIKQQTNYPWEGDIKITIEPKTSDEFTVFIRIPGWAQNQPVPSDLYKYMNKSDEKATLKVNGEPVELKIEKGYISINRKWNNGDTIELNLPMPIRRVLAHEKVEDNKGKVALERGPIVYCVEWPDNDGKVLNLIIPDDSQLKAEYQKDLLNGVVVINGKAKLVERGKKGEPVAGKEKEFVAIPYYAWAHRGRGEMTVWPARVPEAARPEPLPTIAYTSKVSASFVHVSLDSIKDQLLPRSSADSSNLHLDFWPHKDTTEWVQYDFEKPEEVYAAEVYWFDDTGRGECRVPKSWRILYKDEQDQWKPVYTTDEYGVEKDKHNKVTFETVKTDALRLEIQLQENFSAGIHEWCVK